MEINQIQCKDIQKQAIFIGTSKLIALSMPMMDLMMLSHWSSYQALSDYVLSTHLVQVFIAIILALSVGVHIFFNQSENKVLAIRQNMAYAYMLTLIIAILSVIFFYSLDYIHHFS
ncbi:MAG: hypothetical protein Q4D05_00695, partial [Acinetobacter sp.]|nr:hypothetical protein [Acinetobacter sp.]